jgi:fructose-1,6-bisphosphatase-3
MKLTKEELAYYKLLARSYPTIQAASTEIINLSAILNLPKGTEHFMSDIHGEYESFIHIVNNASGVVKEKLMMFLEILFHKKTKPNSGH